MTRSFVSVLALALAASPACGGTPAPAPAAPVPSAKPVASAPTSAVPPLGTDTSAVPEPKNLLVVARIKDASKALKAVHAWSQLPMPKDDAITEILTTEAVGGLVDLEQPVDVAVAVAGAGARLKEQVVVSAAIKNFEKAKVAFLEHFKLSLDNGMLHVDGLGRASSKDDDDDDDERAPSKGEKKKDDENEDRRHCALAPAYSQGGAGAVRLVCGWSLASLHALGPYVTRTVPRTPPKTDFSVQLRTAPVKQMISEQKPMLRGLISSMIGMRGAGRGVGDLAGAIGMDLADLALDLDTATLDATLDDTGSSLDLSAKFGGQTAALTKLATQHPERTDVAPAAFWQLPADAEVAMFHRGIDKEQLDSGRDLFANVIGSQLALDGVTDPERQAILDAFKKMTSGAPGVFAAGLDTAKVRRAFAEQRQLDRYSSSYYRPTTGSDEKRFEARRAAAEAIFGWTVFGVEEGSTKIAAAARDLVAAFGKPKIATAYKTKRQDGPWPAMRIGATPKGAPKDALHLEVDLYPYLPPVASPKPTIPPKPTTPPKPAPPKPGDAKPEEKVPPKPLRIHLLVVPDGATRTWIVVAADEAMAVAKAQAVLATAPDADKLAKRDGLDALRSAKLGAGGFVTQRGWPGFSQRFAALGGNFVGIGEHYDDITAAQHGGTTPIVYGFTAQSPSEMTATLKMPRAAIEDFVVSFIKKLTGG